MSRRLSTQGHSTHPFTKFKPSARKVTYSLDDGMQLHKLSPKTFELPPARVRRNLKPGDIVKLIFRITDGKDVCVERMWVIVLDALTSGYLGELNSDPYCTAKLRSGMAVIFQPDHVIQVQKAVLNPEALRRLRSRN